MAKLAIKEGNPVFKGGMKVIAWPRYSQKDIQFLSEVLRSRKWCRAFAANSKVLKFENRFARFQDSKYGIATANGTVSLQLALRTLGVGIGDEIIVPAVTFIASASCVAEIGAIPVFADIDLETGQIDPASIEKNITSRTKGVIGVHYGGYPIDFDKILPIVRRHKLFLLEDAAHAHGTAWKGKKVGAIGDMGSFSFQESKALTSGEGGIVLTDKKQLAEKARLIHNIGRVMGKPGYGHVLLSSNYRLSEFQGAVLLSQMERLKEDVELKHRNGKYLNKCLRQIGGLRPLKEDERITKRGYYFFVLRYLKEAFEGVSRGKFLEALKAEGIARIGCGYGRPLYRQRAFRKENIKYLLPDKIGPIPDYENLNLPQSEKFCVEQIAVSHVILLSPREEIEKLLEAFSKVKENIKELL